ncbi:MAG: hypothetical protein PWP23_256 [Candidatus Sumerlaeota bacterium]|nr:hypothetical protein [Candidatus Sumerlaeota bacterium]
MTKPDRRRDTCFLALLVAASAFVASCSPVSRYEVLSAVFDGVPPPAGVEAAAVRAPLARTEAPSKYLQDLRTLREQRPPAKPALVIRSVHQPVAERKCRACHDPAAGIENIAKDATLCDQCHEQQRREEGWDHGPINLGTCIPCHVAHRSQHEHLLAEALPGLCLHCHEDTAEEAAGMEYHSVPNFEDCSACHDPHRMY